MVKLPSQSVKDNIVGISLTLSLEERIKKLFARAFRLALLLFLSLAHGGIFPESKQWNSRELKK
jgi:hypothetical protein